MLKKLYGVVTWYLRREWFLSLLLALYVVLLLNDHSLLKRSPYLIDWKSLLLISSLIFVSRGLELSGVLTRLSIQLLSLSSGSEKRLMLMLLPVISLSSALIMNDTAMFIFIPLVLVTSRMADINSVKVVTFSAIAANIGSALTPIGNPQNIILWNAYGFSFKVFVQKMLPFVMLWLSLILFFILLIEDKRFSLGKLSPVSIDFRLFALSFALLLVDIALAETGNALLTLPVTLAFLTAFGREALFSFDWVLILVFTLIFIDFGEISQLIVISRITFLKTKGGIFLTSTLLSQAISNVPATVVFLRARPEWLPLALGVNLGGTGMITGSLANLIALRVSGISIKDFHRFSIPYFLLALGLSLLMLLLQSFV